MELRHLLYFLAVADTLNFTRAAKLLNIAQPAISKQMADLEKHLGTALFIRTKRGVSLTAAGTSFQRDARTLLDDAERIKENCRRAARGQTGRLSVGFFGAPTTKFLPRVICFFRRAYPNVSIELHELNPSSQINALKNGLIDVGFNRPIIDSDKSLVNSIELFRESLKVAVQIGYKPEQETITLAEVVDENIVLLERSEAPGLHDLILSFFAKNNRTLKIVAYPNMMSTAMTFVASRVGLAIVPESVANLSNPGVRFLTIKPTPPRIPLEIQWLKKNRSPIVQSFLEILKERFTDEGSCFI